MQDSLFRTLACAQWNVKDSVELCKIFSKLVLILKTRSLKVHSSQGFYKLDEIGNNANIGIRGFTT